MRAHAPLYVPPGSRIHLDGPGMRTLPHGLFPPDQDPDNLTQTLDATQHLHPARNL